MNEKTYEWAVKDIAEATGQNIQVVRRHVREGRVNCESVLDVSRYVMGRVLVGPDPLPPPPEVLPAVVPETPAVSEEVVEQESGEPSLTKGMEKMARILAAANLPVVEEVDPIELEADEYVKLEKMLTVDQVEFSCEETARYEELGRKSAVRKRAMRKMGR